MTSTAVRREARIVARGTRRVNRRFPMCIEHKDGWCRLKPGTVLDADAISDATACGQFVTMRIGSERRIPDCAECLKTMRKTA